MNAQGSILGPAGLGVSGCMAGLLCRVRTLTPVITMGKALCREQTILESPFKKKKKKPLMTSALPLV